MLQYESFLKGKLANAILICSFAESEVLSARKSAYSAVTILRDATLKRKWRVVDFQDGCRNLDIYLFSCLKI